MPWSSINSYEVVAKGPWSQIKDLHTGWHMSELLCHDGRSAKHETRQGSNTNKQEKSKEVT